MNQLRIGTAGWSIPRDCAASLPGTEAHLDRYSRVLSCAEINSSFYRPHRPSTYARWAAATPDGFLFSVKVRKTITHESSLAPSAAQFRTFVEELAPLSPKLGPLLFQLPPKQDFDLARARGFLSTFRAVYPDGPAAVEPRHVSWFTTQASELLAEFQIARVIADPPRAPAAQPGGYANLIYYRLHGAPRVYYSSYSEEALQDLATTILAAQDGTLTWCIFDNTASGAALANALTLKRLVLPR